MPQNSLKKSKIFWGSKNNRFLRTSNFGRFRAITVTGTHDLACITGDIDGFNSHAEEVVNWTRKVIKDKNFEFLSILKGTIKLKINDTNIVIVYGNPEIL